MQDFRLKRQHPFELLRRDIVALVVDDQVLLAVGNRNSSGFVDMTDVAGMKPAILNDTRRFRFVTLIALHNQRSAHENLAVLCNFDLGIL